MSSFGIETGDWFWGVFSVQMDHLLDYFKSFLWVPMGYLRRWVGILRGGSQECPNCWTCKELVEHVLIECALCDSQRLIIWLFEESPFSECSWSISLWQHCSWYNRLANFVLSVWDISKQLLCGDGPTTCMAQQNNPTPECVVNGTEYCDDWRVSDLFIYDPELLY